ncbi:1-aminocyclopropane-1-carboxylate deaminase/D-cysteine desulfhydrase [Chitinophaga filiformis]|uniref:1-aminocyclopropane-1-carboxylate deaminase n=1 Tax=Chitinophaga filiformis TaxID=104663 RepID=A0A1G7QF14_CHIFI|nr:pyridoxal-phosphate dependent enzyme [Chitinophaga filiformis]SDF97092.1 1-aminocyclopropane-1-carboxylate deaminase [Chitinophaga filiformis]
MNIQFDYNNIILQTISPSWLPDNIRASVLRLDLLHPEVSGNKWFKLRYNLEAAFTERKTRILTFGGAYSNHIAATAAACKLAGIACTGVIRGEQPPVLSHTLQEASLKGMELRFISREAYRLKNETDWQALYRDAYVVPEGGNNALGAKGCEEILSLVNDPSFTHIACAVGTGTTLAGLINSAALQQEIRGYVVLKGAAYLEQEIQLLLASAPLPHWQLLHQHHGGGYAKVTPALTEFIRQFYEETQIPLDIVYTGKLLMGFRQDVLDGVYPAGSNVLLIHTGGLQGNPIPVNSAAT